MVRVYVYKSTILEAFFRILKKWNFIPQEINVGLWFSMRMILNSYFYTNYYLRPKYNIFIHMNIMYKKMWGSRGNARTFN
jgi:hypothetical protein